jgi:ectoine hydroxylase-related dioxygenase (phytanoyl-CoA dioxygenase family)
MLNPNIPSGILASLDEPYELSDSQISFFQQFKYIKLKEVLSEEIIEFFNDVISKKVDQINADPIPFDEKDTYGKAFIQIFNLWNEDKDIKAFVFSKRLAKIAADLMEVKGVRIYHDQALFKESGGGITPWHADQYYWPLETDKTITAWVPLQEIPLSMGPLEFSAGSHQLAVGRELEIGDDSEAIIQHNLKITDFKHVIEPFDLGEVSFHSGWLFHRAGANLTQQCRKVMTVIYMDKNMGLRKPENKNQINDWHRWCPGSKIGEIINSPLNPVIYQS